MKKWMKVTVLSLGLTLGFGAVQQSSAFAGSTTEVSYTNYSVITIKKGDTLYSLSKKYHTTVDILKKLNQLKSNTVKIGQKLKVPAASVSNKISLKLQKGYALEQEEPGKTVLLYQKDTTYFVRIEVLDSKASMDSVKKEALAYMKATGKVQIMDPNKAGHKFYKGALLYLHASNSKIGQNLVIKKVDGKLVKFTIHYKNTEGSEGITPYMINILTTAKF